MKAIVEVQYRPETAEDREALEKFTQLISVAEPDPDTKARFVAAAIKSGMRETTCEVCGCWLLTRGNDNRCPPHRQNNGNTPSNT